MPLFTFRGRSYNNPVELTLAIIGGKWKMPILWRLRNDPWRYGALKRDLGRITHKVLSEQLRELERDGLITRTVLGVIPAHVEYGLTPLGLSVIPLIEALRTWGANYRSTDRGGE